MTQLVLDNLEPKIVESLKARAIKHNHSWQDGLKAILQKVVEAEMTEHLRNLPDAYL